MGLAIAADVETDLDFTLDTITASDFRVLGHHCM